MPEMFAPSQYLRHHGAVERTSILMTDGRYSGVTKGACIGHVTPEAYEGGGIGALENGDLLWMRLDAGRIDVLDKQAFLAGNLSPVDGTFGEARRDLTGARMAGMEKRRNRIAACCILDHVTDAELGVVPDAVNRRATLRWR